MKEPSGKATFQERPTTELKKIETTCVLAHVGRLRVDETNIGGILPPQSRALILQNASPTLPFKSISYDAVKCTD